MLIVLDQGGLEIEYWFPSYLLDKNKPKMMRRMSWIFQYSQSYIRKILNDRENGPFNLK